MKENPLPEAPEVWNDFYSKLKGYWEANGRRGAPPPNPIILTGWECIPEIYRWAQWDATIRWAKDHGLENFISDVKSETQTPSK